MAQRDPEAPDAGLTLDYADVRKEIRDGDVLCFRGAAALSKVIMKLSKGQFSHGALAFWWNDRLMVLQAELGPGVQAVPVSRAVGRYDGRVEWFTLRDEHRTAERIDTLRRAAQMHLGDPYSAVDLFLVGLHYAIGTPLPKVRRTEHEFVCSQYVAYCYAQAGLDLAPSKPDIGTTPEDLARSPFLQHRGTLRLPPRPASMRRAR